MSFKTQILQSNKIYNHLLIRVPPSLLSNGYQGLLIWG